MCCERRFLEELHRRGLRLTPQRELVLSVLHDVDEHSTAEEIHARVGAISAAIDLSTVYRTLELLQELGLVAPVDLGDGLRRFDLLSMQGAHHHLRCRLCGRMVRVEPEEVEAALRGLAAAHGFVLASEHLVIAGTCAACAPKAEDGAAIADRRRTPVAAQPA